MMASAVSWQWRREAAPQKWVWNEKLASGGFERKIKKWLHQPNYIHKFLCWVLFFFFNQLDWGKFLVYLSIWVGGVVSFVWWRSISDSFLHFFIVNQGCISYQNLAFLHKAYSRAQLLLMHQEGLTKNCFL